MDQKVLKTGNSLAVTIPANFAQTIGVRPGQTVHAKADIPSARLTFTFKNPGQLPLLPKR